MTKEWIVIEVSRSMISPGQQVNSTGWSICILGKNTPGSQDPNCSLSLQHDVRIHCSKNNRQFCLWVGENVAVL